MLMKDVIKKLHLEPLTVEGGYFRETYRSASRVADRDRCCGTSIYYLLGERDVSTWHKVASDEIWMYHAGCPAVQMLLYPCGSWEERVIGPDIAIGQHPQSVIPAGTWQAAVLIERDIPAWGLFGAVVYPGFEYDDFEAGSGADLAEQYPGAAARIKALGLL